MKFRSQKFQKAAMAVSIVSTFSMVTTPLVQAAEATENAKQVMEQSLKEMKFYQGKDKQLPLKNIWAQVKQYVPKNQKIMMDDWMVYHGDQKMPRMESQEVVGSQGQKNIRLMLHYPQGSLAVTYLGSENAFMKVGDQVLTRAEVLGFVGAQNKLAKEKVVKAQVVAQKKVTDASMPRMSYEMWNAMKPEQRAEYLVWVRIMLEQAQEVHRAKLNAGNSSKEERSYAQGMLIKIQGMFAALNGYEAGAATTVENANSLIGKDCVVAGWASTFQRVPKKDGKGTTVGCDIMGITSNKITDERVMTNDAKPRDQREIHLGKMNFNNSELVLKCDTGNVPCNPFIYGPNKCVSYGAKEFENASDHSSRAQGQCDSKNQLVSDETFAKFVSASSPSDKKKIIENDSKLNENSKKLIDDILKSSNISGLSSSPEFGDISQAQFDLLKKNVFGPFEENIAAALKACSVIYDIKSGQKSKGDIGTQGPACEGLRARQLAMEIVLLKYTPKEEAAVPPVAVIPPPVVPGCDLKTHYVFKAETGDQCLPMPTCNGDDKPVKKESGKFECVGSLKGEVVCDNNDPKNPCQKEEGTCSGEKHKWCVGAAVVGAGIIGYLLGKHNSTKTVKCMPPLIQVSATECKPAVICAGNVAANAEGKCPGECPANTTRNPAGQCVAGSVCRPGSTLAPDGITCLAPVICSNGSSVLNVSDCPVTCTYPLVKQGNTCVVPRSEGGTGTNTTNPGAGGVRGTR